MCQQHWEQQQYCGISNKCDSGQESKLKLKGISFLHAGKCKDFLSSSTCKEVDAGEGAIAECISDLISAAEAGEQDAGEQQPWHCAVPWSSV